MAGRSFKNIAGGGDVDIKESIGTIVATVVGVIGISVFSPMIDDLVVTGGGLCNNAAADAAATSCANLGTESPTSYNYPGSFGTARTIIGFVPVFYAITLLMGAIATIGVVGKAGYDQFRR